MDNKVVCGCFNVTMKDLKNAVANGATSFEEVQSATSIGSGCKHCLEGARAAVVELLV